MPSRTFEIPSIKNKKIYKLVILYSEKIFSKMSYAYEAQQLLRIVEPNDIQNFTLKKNWCQSHYSEMRKPEYKIFIAKNSEINSLMDVSVDSNIIFKWICSFHNESTVFVSLYFPVIIW